MCVIRLFLKMLFTKVRFHKSNLINGSLLPNGHVATHHLTYICNGSVFKWLIAASKTILYKFQPWDVLKSTDATKTFW